MIRNITFSLLLAVALTGCMSSNKQTIPRRGEVVAQGTGALSFRAPDRGMVSVYDVNSDGIIHTSGVSPNSVIAVNPLNGNITLTDADHAGTQTVYTGLNKSHRYEIWFISARGATYTTMQSTQVP